MFDVAFSDTVKISANEIGLTKSSAFGHPQIRNEVNFDK